MTTPYEDATRSYVDLADTLHSVAQGIVDATGRRGIGEAVLDGPNNLKIDYVQGRLNARRLHYGNHTVSFTEPRDDLTTQTPLEATEGLLGSAEPIATWFSEATGERLATDLRSTYLHKIGVVSCGEAGPDVAHVVSDLISYSAESVAAAYLEEDPADWPMGIQKIAQHGVKQAGPTAGPYAAVMLNNNETVIVSVEAALQPFIAYRTGSSILPDDITVDEIRVALGFDVDGAHNTVTATHARIGGRMGHGGASVRALGTLGVRRTKSIDHYISSVVIDDSQRERIRERHIENATAMLEDLGVTDLVSVEPDRTSGVTFGLKDNDPVALRDAASRVLDIRTPPSMQQNNAVDSEERAEALGTLLHNWLRDQYDLIREEHELETVGAFEERETAVNRKDKVAERTIQHGKYTLSIPKAYSGIEDGSTQQRQIVIMDQCDVRVQHPFYGHRIINLPAGVYKLDELPMLQKYETGSWRISMSNSRNNPLV